MQRARILWRYFALSALALLANVACYAAFVRFGGVLTVLFSVAAAVTITVLLAFPIHLLALGWNRLVSWKELDGWFAKGPRAREAIAYAAPVAGYSLLQIFLYFDRTIYRLYDYHLNGFV